MQDSDFIWQDEKQVSRITVISNQIVDIKKKLTNSRLSTGKRDRLVWQLSWLSRKVNGGAPQQPPPAVAAEATKAYRYEPWDRKLHQAEVSMPGDSALFVIQGPDSSHGSTLEVQKAAELRVSDSRGNRLSGEEFLARVAELRQRGRASFVK